MFIAKIRRMLSYNLLKTVYVNFRIFPFKIAKQLPLQVGWRVDFRNLYRGCVIINDGTVIKRFMVKIGISPFPMISTKNDYTLIRFAKGGHIAVGDDTYIHNGVSLITSEGGFIHIGVDCVINQRTKIYSQKGITIGNHCSIGWECQILDSDCHLVYNENKGTIGNPFGEITIGNNVWIGSRSSVMKGVTIPSYSIVSGNSVVLKSFADINTKGNLFAGSPAVLKATGVYRLLNLSFEKKMKNLFWTTGDKYISESELNGFVFKNYLSRE